MLWAVSVSYRELWKSRTSKALTAQQGFSHAQSIQRNCADKGPPSWARTKLQPLLTVISKGTSGDCKQLHLLTSKVCASPICALCLQARGVWGETGGRHALDVIIKPRWQLNLSPGKFQHFDSGEHSPLSLLAFYSQWKISDEIPGDGSLCIPGARSASQASL